MSKVKNTKNSFSDLRKRAEKKIGGEGERRAEIIISEKEHELEVHKVELEMQNDELIYTQLKLLKSIEEYAGLFDFVPIGYFILDIDGVVLNVNQKGVKQLGFSKKQIIGKPLPFFMNSQSSQDDYYRHRNFVTSTGKSQQIECEINGRGSTMFYAMIESAVVKDEHNNFKHILTTISDISVKRQEKLNLEAALLKEKELNDMKSRFVTLASHEFRTPLSAILTSVDIIRMYIENNDIGKCNKHIDRIKTSVSNLTEILDDFLSLDKLDHGKVVVVKYKVDLKKLAEETIEVMKLIMKKGQIIQYVHIGNTKIILDGKILRHILMNLVSNAIKYSGEGSKIGLNINVLKNKILINVIDNGIGIPKKDQGEIFSKFYRAKNAELIQGTGLGLNIVKKYSELLNGKVSFISAENKGSVFSVEIPI